MAKTLAKVFGVLIILFGIIGFFSNSFVGSGAYFEANVALGIVNIILGLILLLATISEESAAGWLKVEGVLYFALGILGFLLMQNGSANVLGFLNFNNADSWLYAILGFVLFVGSFTQENSVRVIRPMESHHHAHQ